ncbi:MAG: InlB B-repeat-containing protein [Clostridia bacterium]|nr:InlB B-repeat-containing protein [Clostridia bacterium]
MNKATKWVSLVIASAVCVSSVAVMAACNGEQEEKEYTVTFYDGNTVLDTQKVKEGEKATKWTPVKTDYTFDDWYATPNFAHLFDFDAPVTEDKSAFAKFTSSLVVEDTREFYICGQGQSPALGGSSLLKDAGKMTKAADKNEYTLTVDLYENDWFQFVTNTSWNYQHGWGYLDTGSADGTEYFASNGSIDGSKPAKMEDIKCKADGNYTFTLTTHPADDMDNPTGLSASDTITWKRNGDVQGELQEEYTYYLKGAQITEWKDFFNPATIMQATNTEGVYTLSVYLKEGDQFMFASTVKKGDVTEEGNVYIKAENLDEASKAYVGGEKGNMTAKASGTYTFTYTAKTETADAQLSVAFDANKGIVAADYYLDGTFGDGHNWANNCFNSDYKLTETESGSGVYKIIGVELTAGTEFCIQAFKAGSTDAGDQWVNQVGNYNYRYYDGAANLFEAANPAPAGNNYNFKVVTAGTYNITFDSYTKIVNIKSADAGYDIYVKGGMNGWNHNFDAQYKMTESESDANVYEITLAFEENWELGLAKYDEGAASGNGDWIGLANLGTSGDANEQFSQETGNLKCKTAGTYKVTYNLETGTIDFYAVANA